MYLAQSVEENKPYVQVAIKECEFMNDVYKNSPSM
jgi:hypothetical protein